MDIRQKDDMQTRPLIPLRMGPHLLNDRKLIQQRVGPAAAFGGRRGSLPIGVAAPVECKLREVRGWPTPCLPPPQNPQRPLNVHSGWGRGQTHTVGDAYGAYAQCKV